MAPNFARNSNRASVSRDSPYRKPIGLSANSHQLAFGWIFRENSSLEQLSSATQFQEAIP